MKYFLLLSLFFSLSFADLQSDIYSKSQYVCYLKYNGNGLQATDYNPTIISQSIVSTDIVNNNNDCSTWQSTPYVNIDSSTYSVVADMSCDVTSEVVDGTTYYTRTIKRYSLSVDCHYDTNSSLCVIPKDGNGLDYEKTSTISESECTVSTLQNLHDSSNPAISYIIDDAKFLNCPDNSSIVGCYYTKHIKPDNNSTDGNISSSTDGSNSSVNFDDTNIVNAIHEIRDLHKGEINSDTGFFDTFVTYYEDMNSSINELEKRINEIKSLFDDTYTPQYQQYNTCTIYFPILNRILPVDMCRYSPILRPYIVFVLTILMLILLIRLHFYLFPKVYKIN